MPAISKPLFSGENFVYASRVCSAEFCRIPDGIETNFQFTFSGNDFDTGALHNILMTHKMVRTGKQFQVLNSPIQLVFIFMVNDVPFRNVPMLLFPHQPMNVDTLTVQINGWIITVHIDLVFFIKQHPITALSKTWGGSINPTP